MSNWTVFCGWCYTQALRLYPKEFRAEFGDEMQSVFNESIRASSGRRPLLLLLRELCDLPGSLIAVYATTGLSGGKSTMNEESISPSTRWQAFWGVLPFLAFGAYSMIGKGDHAYHLRAQYAEWGVYALALAGLLVGWIRGFPLWSYSYLGWSLVLTWSGPNVSINGLGQNQAWIPLAITVLVALLWTRSLQPLKKLLRDIWGDWTRLSLALYALGGWMSMLYDENHHPYLLAFVLASTLVAASAAWFFLRSSNLRGRILSIVASLVIAMIISSICWGTWDWYEFNGIPRPPTTWTKQVGNSMMLLFFWGLFLFWPFIVELVRRKATRRTG